MLLVVFIVRAVDVAVTQRQFQIRRDLTAPLTGLAILLGGLHCLVDRQQGLLVLLRDQAGNGILSLAAVDALCFKDICKRDTARNHNLSCTGNLVSHNKNPPSICFLCIAAALSRGQQIHLPQSADRLLLWGPNPGQVPAYRAA